MSNIEANTSFHAVTAPDSNEREESAMFLERLFQRKAKSPQPTEVELWAWINVPLRKAYYEKEIADYANRVKGGTIKSLINRDVRGWEPDYGEQRVKEIAQIEKRFFIFRWYSRWRYSRKNGSYKLARRLVTLYGIAYLLKNKVKGMKEEKPDTEEHTNAIELQVIENTQQEKRKNEKEKGSTPQQKQTQQSKNNDAVTTNITSSTANATLNSVVMTTSPQRTNNASGSTAKNQISPQSTTPKLSNNKTNVPPSNSNRFLSSVSGGIKKTVHYIFPSSQKNSDSKQETKAPPKPSASSQTAFGIKSEPSQALTVLPYSEEDKALVPFFNYITLTQIQEQSSLDKLNETFWGKSDVVKSLKEISENTNVKIHLIIMRRQVTDIRQKELSSYSKLINYALSQLSEPSTKVGLKKWVGKIRPAKEPESTLPETPQEFQKTLKGLPVVKRALETYIPYFTKKEFKRLFHPDKTVETKAEREAAIERAEKENTEPCSSSSSPVTRKDVTTEACKDYKRVLEVWQRNLEIKPLEDVTEQCRELSGEKSLKKAGLHRRYRRVSEAGSENDNDSLCLLTDLAALVYNGQREVLARLSQEVQGALLVLEDVLHWCDKLEKAVEEVKKAVEERNKAVEEVKKAVEERNKAVERNREIAIDGGELLNLSKLIETKKNKIGPLSKEEQKELNTLETEYKNKRIAFKEKYKEELSATTKTSLVASTSNQTQLVPSSSNCTSNLKPENNVSLTLQHPQKTRQHSSFGYTKLDPSLSSKLKQSLFNYNLLSHVELRYAIQEVAHSVWLERDYDCLSYVVKKRLTGEEMQAINAARIRQGVLPISGSIQVTGRVVAEGLDVSVVVLSGDEKSSIQVFHRVIDKTALSALTKEFVAQENADKLEQEKGKEQSNTFNYAH